MKRGGPLRRRTRLRRESPKRQAERERRDEVREEVKQRARWRCEAAALVPEIACGGRMDVDEIVLRSGRPGGHLDPDNCQLLCRSHHRWKHDFPAEAERRGLRRWSWHDGETSTQGGECP